MKLRYQRVSDAKRYHEILNNPNFKYISAMPGTIRDEEIFLSQGPEKRRKNIAYNYAVVHLGKVVGGIGVIINQSARHIGILGYFIEEAWWGKGFATKALKAVEKIGFEKLKLTRLEILIACPNKASVKVAQKCGYVKEGMLRKRLFIKGRYEDAYLFAKTR
ncbi:MAG: GNAT family N-acetyltransferase [Planctomycetes bacterium]|nr:GNAT family N-acetyltransferase [Planctomycetota bacterium]